MCHRGCYDIAAEFRRGRAARAQRRPRLPLSRCSSLRQRCRASHRCHNRRTRWRSCPAADRRLPVSVTSVNFHLAGVGMFRILGPIVAKEMVAAALDGDIKVGAPVVIEVAPRYAFHISQRSEAICRADFGECAIVVVMKELRGWDRPGVDSWPTNRSSQPSLS